MKHNRIIISKPEHVKILINELGMQINEFLNHTCGVSYSTFTTWAQKQDITSDMAKVLFTYIQNHPEAIPELRNIRKKVAGGSDE